MSCFGENWGEEFSPEEIEEARARGGLLSMELELSRACNLRCLYCYAASGVAPENELSLEQILGAVDQAAGLGARKIIVLGGGEPLMFPGLQAVLDRIIERGMQPDLFTNGTLMTRETARVLYEKGVSVVVKLNSLDPATQDMLAGHLGTFDAIQKGIEALQEAGYPDRDHRLGVETIICAQNYDELEDLWCWARDQCIVPYVEMMTLQGRARENPGLEVSPERSRDLFERLARIDEERYDLQWDPHPPLAASHCARHEYSCTVTSTGDVHPCPGVDLSCGNIKEIPLRQILATSQVIQDLRNVRERIKGRCGTCELAHTCYGCRGHAYQVTGDYLSEDPTCWLIHD